ncbi:DNA polymerase III subunit gamma/tau [Larsenimonas suaedae]|uniref:DNA polymerase III subunit gamma/tau n=1 Tax=Larsenimonas suaedae TaxID=1851019 RepID=A0ABU1GZM5_9GAMM|nr:DNA polymerase III subunit gamma/tau [Larsenimonas suaedae]MCM2972778.1 DNA polymerase III subunit gamma/tau [Larsenimonas suaedae]MDR5896877.1 DNA polymerase III subunit gamma/tau [Larsenimonas suaedae]
MSYQVLARKWRPRTFHELVGQDHVSRALINALDQGRLHHAYLFTGTRGVGKTTLARILAKCLNCEQGVSSSPCGQCPTCRDIDEGRFVDLIEVDAASRTKVEDTRELLDNVQYAPTQGRYKVYLVDEVHMLSTHSFNALLKTLEEPPPHVKFLLATTDPQKLPVTVLSRCLQFALKHMPPEKVVSHLTHVLTREEVDFDERALWLLGRAANGSMRDALSLTDQAVAFGQGAVRGDDVASMLGTLDHHHVMALSESLASMDARALLATVAELAEQGPDFSGVLDELVGLFHRLAIAQMVPDALDNAHGDRDAVKALARRFTAEDVQLYYQMALQGRADMAQAPDPRAALEMTLLRMLAFRPQGVPKPPETPLPITPSSAPEVDAPQAGPATLEPAPAANESADDVASPQPAPPAEPEPPARQSSEPYPERPMATETTPAPPEAFSNEQASPAQDAPPPWSDEALAAYADFEAPASTQAQETPRREHPDAPPPAEPERQSVPGHEHTAEAPDAATPLAPTSDDASMACDGSRPTPDGAEVACGAMTHAQWLALFPRLELRGLTASLMAHCALKRDDGTRLVLALEPSQSAMLSDVHQGRLEQALEAIGWPRQTQFEVESVPEHIETPKRQRDRLMAERQARAVDALTHDPHIQSLTQAFDAHLIETSVVSFEPDV